MHDPLSAEFPDLRLLNPINAAGQAAKIKRKITDESGQYSVWVEVEE
jgi:hypothetical protein